MIHQIYSLSMRSFLRFVFMWLMINACNDINLLKKSDASSTADEMTLVSDIWPESAVSISITFDYSWRGTFPCWEAPAGSKEIPPMNYQRTTYSYSRINDEFTYSTSCKSPVSKHLTAEQSQQLNQAIAGLTLVHFTAPDDCMNRTGGEHNSWIIELPSGKNSYSQGNPDLCQDLDYLEDTKGAMDTLESLR